MSVSCLLMAACSLVYSVDDYAGGSADADAGVDAPDARPDAPDTSAPDTAAPDTSAPDTAADAADTKPDVVDSAPDTALDTADSAEVPPTPLRHTITIDGTNDFTPASEKLSTTTTAFDAYVTWDASAIFVGYVGADLGATASATKWLLVYLDRDPGAATGATKTEKYSSQQHTLPTGFGAEAYFAIKTDGSFSQLKLWSGTTWDTATSNPVTKARNASIDYIEMKIPLSVLGATAPTKVGVVSFLLNETASGEWTWAGLWSGSFTDGASLATAPFKIGSYAQVDFSSALAPNSASNKKP